MQNFANTALANGRSEWGPSPSPSSRPSPSAMPGPPSKPVSPPPRLPSAYFALPCVRLAKALLGQVLARRLPDGTELRGRIVETEAYLGGEDAASHSRGGRRTARNAAMFMAPGTLYVYQIYGTYFCLNISSQGDGAAVLLRSLEPLQGQDAMRRLRLVARRSPGAARAPLRDWQLCNGPSKLCQAFAVDKSFDRQDLARTPTLWLEPGSGAPGAGEPVCSARVGISGEWADKPLRFYIRGNRCVSVRDKAAEAALLLHVAVDTRVSDTEEAAAAAAALPRLPPGEGPTVVLPQPQ